MKVVIIGGVAGGASAAARLRRLNEQADIVLLERGNYISYANCGLPYYIGGEIKDKAALSLQTPAGFGIRFNVDVRTGHEALAIDRAAKVVRVRRLADGWEYTESYDKLVYSPGASPLRPDVPGVDDARVFTLRTIPDMLAIHDYIRLRRPKTALVVGGGYIGMELAENLTRAGLRVTIAEYAEHVMGPLDGDMAAGVHLYLRRRGVDLRLGNGLRALEPAPAVITAQLSKGQVTADMVVLAVGVQPESGLAREAGLALSTKGSVLVDNYLRTSDEDIYAVGDVVGVRHFVGGQDTYLPLAGPANKQGRIAADNICGRARQYHGTQGSAVVKIFDMTVATTGLNERDAARAGLDYDKVHLSPASHAGYYPGGSTLHMKVLFERGSGRLLGAQLVGFDGADKRCDVLATAIRAGMDADELAGLELCYAPPYSSAKDPVNMAAFLIQNITEGLLRQFHWHEVDALPRDGSITLLDVRTSAEVADGGIPGALHIPVDDVRERLEDIPEDKPVYVYCHSGVRSAIACRILMQNGFTAYNLSGGYSLYATIQRDQQI